MGKSNTLDKEGKKIKMSDNFKGQKYSSLKKACLKKGELFQDSHFPANNKSLFYSKIDKEVEWKRPGELCKVPKLVVDGVTNDDLNEGELGSTWFVSACSALAKEPKLFNKVIPDVKVQEWNEKNEYAGIFRFQFWRYGRWLEVVIDDQLPTKKGKLIFCHSHSRNEFWSALLEKAYAKLYGDYESLEQGFTADALVDFTGGVPEKLMLKDMGLSNKEQKKALFASLVEANENKALINCCIAGAGDGDQGLVKGHGYIMTDLREIKLPKALKGKLGQDSLQLVRLRNPWGTKEWTGPWSDDSPQWNTLSLKDRQKMGIVFQQEGEFWMAFDDFCDHFTNVDICHFVNTSFFSLKKSWTESMLHGEWTTGAKGSNKDRAGGSDQGDTYLENPQYLVDVTTDQDSVMMSLEQDDMHAGKGVGEEHKKIGLMIFKTEENRKFRLQIEAKKVSVSEYKQSRSIFHKTVLGRGRYVIIPSTFTAGETCEYLLRVYTSSTSANAAVPLLKDFPTSGMCSAPYGLVTRLDIQRAEGIQKKEGVKTMDAYAVVKCEGETVKCQPARNTDAPKWGLQCMFYQKKPKEKPITIEIYNSNMISDDLVGVAILEEEESGKWGEEPKMEELFLYGKGKEGKGKEKESEKPGKLFVEIKCSDELTAF